MRNMLTHVKGTGHSRLEELRRAPRHEASVREGGPRNAHDETVSNLGRFKIPVHEPLSDAPPPNVYRRPAERASRRSGVDVPEPVRRDGPTLAGYGLVRVLPSRRAKGLRRSRRGRNPGT